MADTKKYYWLKLKNNFFTDKRIKKLRKIAGGDTYTIIYLKMQLLSLQDNGNLYYEQIEDTFEEEIALQIDEDVEDVRMTINFLLYTGLLIKQDDNTYDLIETKNSIGKESESAERVRQFRSRKKEEMLQCNVNVINCNTEIELDKEKELDKDIEKENIYEYIENNFGRTLSPIEVEEIEQWEDNDLTRYAIKQAVLNGAYNIKYITRILYNYQKQNIRTVQEAQEKEKNYIKGKTRVKEETPEWFNKELKNETLTDAEKQTIDNDLNEIMKEIGEL